MDTEGTPTQELAALLVDDQWRIVDTYHAFAACKTTDDTFSRRHLHGLEIHILYSIGFPNEEALLFDFLRWAASKKVDTFFVNDPTKERKLFPQLHVEDVRLPMWVARVGLPSYLFALEAKRNQLPIKGAVCGAMIHGAFETFVYPNPHAPSDADILKSIHGFHCALYDSFMIYLYVKHRVGI